MKLYKSTLINPINGFVVGYRVSSPEISPHTFLALTMNREILSLELSKDLVRSANYDGVKVVFIPETDLNHIPLFLSTKEQCRILEMIADYSADDIKTAVLAGYGRIESTVDYMYDAVAYTCNQIIDGEKWHAEEILAVYLKVMGEVKPDMWWLMILEPCFNCLFGLTISKASVIAYLKDHKDKWNTPEYLSLKQHLRNSDSDIVYTKETILE